MNMFGLMDAPEAPIAQQEQQTPQEQHGRRVEIDPLEQFRALNKKTKKLIENEYDYMKIAAEDNVEKLWRAINLTCRFKFRDHYSAALSYYKDRLEKDGHAAYNQHEEFLPHQGVR